MNEITVHWVLGTESTLCENAPGTAVGHNFKIRVLKAMPKTRPLFRLRLMKYFPHNREHVTGIMPRDRCRKLSCTS